MFADCRRVNLNLFAACICYIVASSSVETTSRSFVFVGILFQVCYEYKVRRLNNILIVGNLRDTDIRQCIHNQTNLIYCVNSHYRIGLIMCCYLFLSACKMAWVWAKFKIRNHVTVTP